jgi:hypothetical protein
LTASVLSLRGRDKAALGGCIDESGVSDYGDLILRHFIESKVRFVE